MYRRRAILALCAGLSLASCAVPVAAEVTNRIVARVNDRIATLYDFESRYEETLRRLAQELPEEPAERQRAMEDVARSVMQQLFEELLILSRADQLGVFITEGEVADAIQRMREANGLESDEQFRTALAQSGLTFEELKSQFEQQMAFQRVIGREVYSQIDVGEEDLRRYYRDNMEEFREPERIQVREIVVLDEAGSSDRTRAVAAEVLSALRSGKSFEEVGQAYDDAVLSEPIDLGWVRSGDLAAALEDAVWDLEPGQFSEPIRARGGLHIAQLVDRRESTVRPFKDVEERIRAQQERERTNEKLEEYLAELEEKAYLYLDPPAPAAGFRASSGKRRRDPDFPLLRPSDAEDEELVGKAVEEAAEEATAEEALEPEPIEP